MKMFKVMLVLFFVAASVVPAGAEWQRTIKVEDTLTVGRCKWQVDVNAEYSKLPEALGDKDLGVVGILPRFGVMERWDIAAFIPGVYLKNGDEEYGIGDIEIMTKLMILDDIDDIVGLSIIGAVKTSTGDEDKGLGTGTDDYTGAVAISKVFGDLTLVGNLGYTFIDEGDAAVEYEDLFIYGAEAVYRVCDLYDVHVFIVGETERVKGQDGELMAGAGMTIYPQWEFISFQISGAAGLTDDSPDFSAEAKVRVLF